MTIDQFQSIAILFLAIGLTANAVVNLLNARAQKKYVEILRRMSDTQRTTTETISEIITLLDQHARP